MNCSYCGLEFDAEASRNQCEGCAMLHGGGCRSVRCPRCSYEMPEEPKVLGRLAAWFRPKAAAAASPATACLVSLAEMAPGEQGTVAQLAPEDRARTRKLMSLGVLPGSPIALERTRPTFVFRLGYARFAVDEALAQGVLVQRHAG